MEKSIEKKKTTIGELAAQTKPKAERSKSEFSSLSQFAASYDEGYGLSTDGNKYYWRNVPHTNKVDSKRFLISNFVIKPLYLLCHAINPKRVLIIRNASGVEKTIIVEVRKMTDANSFKAVVEGQGNFILNANQEQYSHIKELVFSQEEQAQEIDVLGFQPDTRFYAFGNGIFDGVKFHPVNNFGISTVGEYSYFIPEYSDIYKNDAGYTERRKFVYKKSGTDFKKWCELILKCYGQNGKIGIAYILTCLYRDVIMDSVGKCPMLYLFGQPQSGKSTFRDSFMYLFGEPQTTPSLESASSLKSFNRKLAQTKNALAVFEEYKDDIDKTLIGMLKGIYDGIGYERAETSNDNRTKTTPINSSVIVCGQELPTKEAALFSRSIMLTFAKVTFTDAEGEAYSALREAQAKGLGEVLTTMLQHRKLIESNFKKELKAIIKELKGDTLKGKGMTDRWIENISILIAPVKILGDIIDFGFDYANLAILLSDNLLIQGEIMTEGNEINTFYRVLDEIIDKQILSTNYFDEEIKDKKIRRIIFDFNEAYPVYLMQCKKRNNSTIPERTLKEYLKTSINYKGYASKKKSGKVLKWIALEFEILE
jgi:hypothetical protein